MAQDETRKSVSVFADIGFSATVDSCKREIKKLYLSDQVPWVIGYSGGKDSTAVLQLIWLSLAELPEEQRHKPVHVISTDTLVENPVVARWVRRSLGRMETAARKRRMPIVAHALRPELADTYWVNLIGRGYPAPRNKFRWCTHRLKIKPSNQFIVDVVRENGEAILVLGTRKAESQARARSMAKHEKQAVSERLTPNAWLQNSLVYTPIEDWSNDDVWAFLMRIPNPWGNNNKDLLGMYRGASADGECPIVMDLNTPSCGNSRFGCWVCTLVDEDKSMGAMIQNDQEKEWMLPLLELRNELDFRTKEARQRDRARRDFRRITGRINYYRGREDDLQLVPGPYTQEARAYWLRRVLETQRWVRENGPDGLADTELITLPELQEIRRIWVVEKHELEDLLPGIYEAATGAAYPGQPLDDRRALDRDSLLLLKGICQDDLLRYELTRNLLDIESQYRTMQSRRGLFEALESEIRKCFYEDEKDALARAEAQFQVKQMTFVSDDGREVAPEGFDGRRRRPVRMPRLPLFESTGDLEAAKQEPSQ